MRGITLCSNYVNAPTTEDTMEQTLATYLAAVGDLAHSVRMHEAPESRPALLARVAACAVALKPYEERLELSE